MPPAGLLARLVEHCTSIAEFKGLNPLQAWIFRFSFHNCKAQQTSIFVMNFADKGGFKQETNGDEEFFV